MCGIVGAIAQRPVAKILIHGLKALEYRGYDSSGLCVYEGQERIILKSLGKVSYLDSLLDSQYVHNKALVGIAHTRWATHGRPSIENAHPHHVGDVSLVHNGIIENYLELKEQLQDKGYIFKSSTDTEVLAALIDNKFNELKQKEQELTPLTSYWALKQALSCVTGSYALAMIFDHDPDHILIAKEGSPLVLGLGIGENFIASDVLALSNLTTRFIYLEDGDIGIVGRESWQLFAHQGSSVDREIKCLENNFELLGKGPYKHYMQKEIFEQAHAISNTLMGRLDNYDLAKDAFIANNDKLDINFKELLKDVSHLHIVACGTSYHAALVGKYIIEQYAQVMVSVTIASEYRYKRTIVPSNSLFVTISQSGETADTLAALKLAKKQGYLATLSICNVANSSLVRESDFSFITRAGVEIGVASTKAFTTQLLAFNLLTIALGKAHNTISTQQAQNFISDLNCAPKLIGEVLKINTLIESLAKEFVNLEHCLFLGRGIMYPLALEGALKLKEISYIHAEGYASGELKHGLIALIDEHMPVVVVAPDNELLPKLLSNIQEVSARGGKLYIFTDTPIKVNLDDKHIKVFLVPRTPEFISTLIFTIPLQLLAYHVAVIKGSDVDQPRNLAKSVTVE